MNMNLPERFAEPKPERDRVGQLMYSGTKQQAPCLSMVMSLFTTTDLQPFNTQEAEHVGDMRQVVIVQWVCVQVLTKRQKRTGR